MKKLMAAGSLTLALLLAGCGGDNGGNQAGAAANAGPLPTIPAPNNGDWTQVVSATGEGFRMGNPDAPVKLVEYASITCHVCAEFEEQGGEELKNEYVRSGQVSWEYRPYMLFPTDPGLFMLLRCQGPAPFFRLSQQLYADQKEWTERLQSLPRQQLEQLEALPPQQKAGALVRAAGLDQFFLQRGMPADRIDSCLANQQELQQLSAITARGSKEERVTGTPTFLINGEKVENVAAWSGLEPLLRQKIGQ